MLRLLQRNLQFNKTRIVQLLQYCCDSNFNQATFLTGGLDKFQGGFKEESYFLKKNNKLIIKLKDHQHKCAEILKEEQEHERDFEKSKNHNHNQQEQQQEPSEDNDNKQEEQKDVQQAPRKIIRLDLPYMQNTNIIFAPCKHKNYQEEAFFFNEQIECTKKYGKNRKVNKLISMEKGLNEMDT